MRSGASARSCYPIAIAFVFGAGCGFSAGIDSPATDGAVIKDGGAIDAPDGYLADARVCFGSGFGMTCLTNPPPAPLVLTNIDFDTSGGCTEVVTMGNTAMCVLAGTTVSLPSGTTFRAVGSRPLIVLASTTLTIEGTLSVASRRGAAGGAGASMTPCPGLGAPQNDTGGGGGGAGGSFGGLGGGGGTGDINMNGGIDGVGDGGSPGPAVVPSSIRAGCRGGNGGNGGGTVGQGGLGGGAVYLVAGTSIAIAGIVTAGGAGGGGSSDQSGGSGGGSGGFVGLDAPAISVSGDIAANGGGGGEGGGLGGQLGQPGGDGGVGTARAAGGSATNNDGSNTDGGNGGQGAAGATATGSPGNANNGGGGGGGGGAGYVYVKGSLNTSGTISPPAAQF